MIAVPVHVIPVPQLRPDIGNAFVSLPQWLSTECTRDTVLVLAKIKLTLANESTSGVSNSYLYIHDY